MWMIKLALIGIGGYGATLADSIRQAAAGGRCALVAAADNRLEALGRPAEALRAQGVRLYGDAWAMLDELAGVVRGVYIATSIGSHEELLGAAVQRGYHVHLEKPPAPTVQEVDRMIDTCGRAGRLCLVGFQAIHSRDVRWIKDVLVGGRLGRVKRICCAGGLPRTQSYYRRNGWAGRLRRDGRWVLDGPATNAMLHQLNNMLFWAGRQRDGFGTPEAVRAELYRAWSDHDGHDAAAIELRTVEGPVLRFLGAHCTAERFMPTTRIEAERGSVEWSLNGGGIVRPADGGEQRVPHDDRQRVRMVESFVEAVETDDASRLRVPLAASRKAVLAVDGAHESSRRVHPVPEEATRSAGTGGGRRVIVDGLDEALLAAADSEGLLSDLPHAPPWARPGKWFDLAGYHRFPQRFRCG
jgi:predicted dehydrogenase